MKPIIKWAGGKTQLLKELVPLMPKTYKTYYEPFVGGGALFFNLKPKKAVLNDFNPQLINLYKQCKSSNKELINELNALQKEHDGTDSFYKEKRTEYNNCLKNNELTVRSAALMVYLNKAGFNGLYRLNSSGLFNVPFGKKETVNLYDDDNIKEVSEALNNVRLLTGDFEKACSDCSKGDFVFFDSPYYNTFDTYQAGGFSEEDHRRLANLFKDLTNKGVYCMLTNSNEDFIKDLYKDYNIKVVNVKRMINSDATNRKGQEVIITNYTN